MTDDTTWKMLERMGAVGYGMPSAEQAAGIAKPPAASPLTESIAAARRSTREDLQRADAVLAARTAAPTAQAAATPVTAAVDPMAAKIDRLLAERDERERKATEEAKTARLTVMIDSLLKWERSADTRATFDSQATYVRACLVDAGFDPATDAVAAECFRNSRLSE